MNVCERLHVPSAVRSVRPTVSASLNSCDTGVLACFGVPAIVGISTNAVISVSSAAANAGPPSLALTILYICQYLLCHLSCGLCVGALATTSLRRSHG
jgi:hypothetical protein